MEGTRAALCILRDPRDVALSATDHFGLPLEETIDIMNKSGARADSVPGAVVYEMPSSWSIHVKSWNQRRQGKLHVVRYEDLLADPSGEFGKIARKLRITIEEARIHRAVEHASFDKLQAKERETGFVGRSKYSDTFFRSGQSGG